MISTEKKGEENKIKKPDVLAKSQGGGSPGPNTQARVTKSCPRRERECEMETPETKLLGSELSRKLNCQLGGGGGWGGGGCGVCGVGGEVGGGGGGGGWVVAGCPIS